MSVCVFERCGNAAMGTTGVCSEHQSASRRVMRGEAPGVLESLDSWNRRIVARVIRRNGLACPRCKAELLDDGRRIPADTIEGDVCSQPVICTAAGCTYTGWRVP